MTTTKTRTKQREAARKAVLTKKEAIDAAARQRDELETEGAVDFRLASEDREAARRAEAEAEVAMGQIVDHLIGMVRISYARASELLELSPDELRRLRQLAVDAASAENAASVADSGVTAPAEEPLTTSELHLRTEAAA